MEAAQLPTARLPIVTGFATPDSNRFANLVIPYLLQRMEAYRGLAILATNKHVVDAAFLRRFRFVIDFPAFKKITLPKKSGRETV